MKSEKHLKSNRHNERTQENQRYFQKVVDAYAEFKEYAPLVAINYDPTSRTKKLHPVIVNFLCDVELATKRVLQTPELIRKWETLVSGEQIDASSAVSIVSRCSRIYRERGLAPFEYFKSVRKPLSRGAAA